MLTSASRSRAGSSLCRASDEIGAWSAASQELVNSAPRSPKLRSVPQPAQNGA